LGARFPSVTYPQAMATELDRRDIRLFDYAKRFALPFREAIRAHTEMSGSRGRCGDRVHSAHEELPKGGSYSEIFATQGTSLSQSTSSRPRATLGSAETKKSDEQLHFSALSTPNTKAFP